jgi:hypothetical protein
MHEFTIPGRVIDEFEEMIDTYTADCDEKMEKIFLVVMVGFVGDLIISDTFWSFMFVISILVLCLRTGAEKIDLSPTVPPETMENLTDYARDTFERIFRSQSAPVSYRRLATLVRKSRQSYEEQRRRNRFEESQHRDRDTQERAIYSARKA